MPPSRNGGPVVENFRLFGFGVGWIVNGGMGRGQGRRRKVARCEGAKLIYGIGIRFTATRSRVVPILSRPFFSRMSAPAPRTASPLEAAVDVVHEPNRRSVPVVPGTPVEERFRLPAHRGKAGRVSDHASGLVNDVKEWAELRIELVKKEVERRIEGRLSTVKNQAIVGG